MGGSEQSPKAPRRAVSAKKASAAQAPSAEQGAPGAASQLQSSIGNQAVQRLLQPQAQAPSSAPRPDSGPASHVDAAIGAASQPLGPETRAFMQQRFGQDFGHVRIHTHAQAAYSAAALNARAYTLGSHIVFGAGEYAPHTRSGQSLLAHELAHVVQQAGAPTALQAKPVLGNATDRSEHAADAAADTALDPRIPAGSAALRIRDRLRTTASSAPVIRRAIKTWGGEFDTDKYQLTTDPGMDGLEIELRFKPGSNANAELIGLTQTALSMENGSPIPFSMFGPDEEKARKSRAIPSGEANAGTFIDRISAYGNPLYATNKPGAADTLADTPTVAFWGRHGWRYTDKGGALKKQDALLKDRPQMPSGMKKSKQVFETTALAVKGTQTGTYYGSVRWGWEKNASGTVTKLPLTLVSQGVPSATFGRASELWNAAKTSEGKDTIDLPVTSVQVINSANAEFFATARDAQPGGAAGTPLPIGTRFRILRDVQYVLLNPVVHIEIVDGPMTYQRGYIRNSVAYRNER